MTTWQLACFGGGLGFLIALALEVNRRVKDIERKLDVVLQRQFRHMEKTGASPFDP